ncbi:MAG: response regulator transcription factor [Kiritimatiellae bacterium]|nr:response regulator transcription factor [Kiritimatiellia bacterium]
MIRVAIIDDHVVVRAGLRYVIEAEPDLEFAGEYGGGSGAAEFVVSHAPDVTLLDVRMPDLGGIDVLKEILAINPKARVVMLTTSDVEEDVFRAIEEGALGYVMKESPIETITAAVRSAMAGEVFMTDEIRKIYETRKSSKGLSSREAEALTLAAGGGNNREIALAMGLSENSVKMFLKRAFFKLGAANRAEAVQLAARRGLITVPGA